MLDTATLLSRSEAVAEKMKEGTATRADKEMLVAMNVTAEKRKSEKRARALARDAAEPQRGGRREAQDGHGHTCRREMLRAMTATAEKQKDEIDGLRTAGSSTSSTAPRRSSRR